MFHHNQTLLDNTSAYRATLYLCDLWLKAGPDLWLKTRDLMQAQPRTSQIKTDNQPV